MNYIRRYAISTTLMAIILLTLGGCGSGSDNGSVGPSDTASANNAPASTFLSAASTQETPAGVGCGWQVASDADRANIAFPDTAAKYWVAALPLTPGNRIRIDGQYPNARYFSFNVYDPALRPTDAIADQEISPQTGQNPYAVPNTSYGGKYTSYVQYGDSPTQNPKAIRARNTLYSGNTALASAGLPNGGTVIVIYRIYLSHVGEFFNGGVPLPTLSLESADGKTQMGTLPNCAEPILPTLGGNAPPLGVNKALIDADYPDAVPTYFPIGGSSAPTRKFFSLPDTALQIAQGVNSNAPATPNTAPFNGGGGFLSNIHNAYTSTSFNRRYGNIAIVRAKAPTFRGAKEVGFAQEQLRYWSVCGNEFVTQRYTQCTSDFETPLDANGYFTVVVSDLADRPNNAVEANGFKWLAWGAYPDMVVLVRHMLANPSFKEAIQNQPFGGDLKKGMGAFYPEGVYCDKQTVELSNSPAQAFELCKQYKHNSVPLPF